jgi:hypothetical protein
MTRIRARCPECGDVEFPIDDLCVIGSAASTSAYRFRCPDCADYVDRTAVPDVIELLLSAGARHEPDVTPTVGGRRKVRTHRVADRPITEKDLASFSDLLDSPDWFDALQSTMAPEDTGSD